MKTNHNNMPGHFGQPSASQVQTPGRSGCSQAGRLAPFNQGRRTVKTPAAAMMTPKSAADGFAAGLRAGIRRALDVSRVPNSGFVARQIAIHREFQTRQTKKSTIATQLKEVCIALEGVAEAESWSGRKLAAKIGITDRTWRRIKSGHADGASYLPWLEAAVARLQPSTFNPQPSHEVVQ